MTDLKMSRTDNSLEDITVKGIYEEERNPKESSLEASSQELSEWCDSDEGNDHNASDSIITRVLIQSLTSVRALQKNKLVWDNEYRNAVRAWLKHYRPEIFVEGVNVAFLRFSSEEEDFESDYYDSDESNSEEEEEEEEE
ncbi:hypothetical protein M422DRAFT_52688 [Sphaerobolus stellatus SS14]|uniref:Uncharacterized protein n=1 Tax=Sphaerobolus stellatus (strain SS14) TaxID=990650 RepID=A0A0C9V616_SPHS4|nr:hypothetical protein M422DRAFT_52688 [Sphaerobolus stellatus SS14]